MFQRRDFDLTPINIKQIWIWCNLARVGAIAHCIETSAGSHMMMEDRASVRGSNNMGVDVWAPRWWQVLSKYYATLPQYLDTMTQYCRPVARVWVLSKSTHCVGAQLGLAATPPPIPPCNRFQRRYMIKCCVQFSICIKWCTTLCSFSNMEIWNIFHKWNMHQKYCRVSTICKWTADCNSVSPAALVLIILARGQQFWMVYLIFWIVCLL